MIRGGVPLGLPRIARAIHESSEIRARCEDLAVEAFWGSGGRHSRKATMQAVAYRTAVRLAIDELRQVRGTGGMSRSDIFQLRPAHTSRSLFHRTNSRRRSVCARGLAANSELLLLRSDGLPYEEIATLLSLNPHQLARC